MSSSKLKLEAVAKDTPLRLEVAADLAFPDGSMSPHALRRLAVAKKLGHELVAGKYYTTLADIEEMRKSCRVSVKERDLSSTKVEGDGSSKMVKPGEALAAMNATARRLKENLRTTSLVSATRLKRLKAPVIPIKPK